MEDAIQNIEITERFEVNGAKIVIVGVGGGGQNMIDHLLKTTNIQDNIKVVAMNTDAQALKNSKAPHKVQLGAKTTKGMGCGMKPEVGKEAALESYEEIKKALNS